MSPFWICLGWGFLVIAFANANPFHWESLLARVFPAGLVGVALASLWPEYPVGIIMTGLILGMTGWLLMHEIWQRVRRR